MKCNDTNIELRKSFIQNCTDDQDVCTVMLNYTKVLDEQETKELVIRGCAKSDANLTGDFYFSFISKGEAADLKCKQYQPLKIVFR